MNRPNVKRIQQLVTRVDTSLDCYEGSIAPPLFETSVYRAKDFDTYLHGEQKYVYAKNGNPITLVAEKLIADMEKGEHCKLFSSGTGAIFTALLYGASKGSHMILVKSAYGRSTNFARNEFSRLGIEHTEVDGQNIENFKAALRENTSLIYLESPTSWNFELQDLKAISSLAKERGIVTVIDNTWATPIFQNPIDFGIDIVLHSASKYLSGHSDLIGGVLVTSEEIAQKLTDIGATMSPYIIARLLRSLRTLPMRMVRHEETGLIVANYLKNHKKVTLVSHPGLSDYPQRALADTQLCGYSGTFGFILDTDREGVIRFMNHVPSFNITASWGGYETVIMAADSNPTIEDYSPYGLKPRQIRLSVGAENAEDIISELEEALDQI